MGLAAASFLRPAFAATAQLRFEDNPYTLGIASGSPRSDSVVLWTRLAPKPLEGGGMGSDNVEVAWEVAHDEKFAFYQIGFRCCDEASPP